MWRFWPYCIILLHKISEDWKLPDFMTLTSDFLFPFCTAIYTVSQKKNWTLLFEHNFRKYCPILIILASNLWPSNSPDLNPVDYEIWAVMQHHVYHRQTIVWMNWNSGSSMSGLVQSWTVDFWWGYWPVARKTLCVSVHAKGGHFEYSLWTDNVDFVYICYIQCDFFDYYIFNYEIMPAALANTFLFILQVSALADSRYGGRFDGTLCRS